MKYYIKAVSASIVIIIVVIFIRKQWGIGKAQKILNQFETRKIMFPDERSEVKIFQQEYEVLSDLITIYKQLVERYVVDLALFGRKPM
jgi:hypothetical protein